MRLALILLMTVLATGCEATCKETCDDEYEACLDDGSPTAVCKDELSRCAEECRREADAWDDEDDYDCNSEAQDLDTALRSGRGIHIWIFLILGFIRRIRGRLSMARWCRNIRGLR